VRIDRVNAPAFGPFEDESLDLAPGMTVIHGPNESGKSSWHAALYAGLCGMRRGGGQLKKDKAFAARHRPWDGQAWRVGVEVTLDDGRRVELSHDLTGTVECRATDLVLGGDLSAGMMFDGAPDGSVLLGLNRKALPSTLCIRQADLLGVLNDAGELQEALQRAAATGGTDATAEAALKRIRDFRAERVGREYANAKRPLMNAVRAHRAAAAALEEARAAHTEYLSLTVSRDRAQRSAREARDRLDGARSAVAAREVDEFAKRVGSARELWDDFKGVAPPLARQDEALDRQVSDALSTHRNRPAAVLDLEGPTSAELEAELAALPHAPTGDVAVDPSIPVACRRWERALDALAAHNAARASVSHAPETGGANAGELRQVADELEQRIPEVDAALVARVEELRRAAGEPAGGLRNALLLGAGASLLAALLAGAANQLLLAGLLAVLALALGAVGGRSRSNSPSPVGELPSAEARLAVQQEAAAHARARRDEALVRAGEWGVDADPASLRGLAGVLAEAAYAEQRFAAWYEQLQRLDGEVIHSAADLRAALRDRGADGEGDDLNDAVDAYETACRQRAMIAAQAARREGLAAQLVARRAAERSGQEQRRLHDQADRLLVAAAAAAGVDAATPEAIAGSLEAWQQHSDAQHAAAVHAERRWERLQHLLDGNELEDLEEGLARRRAALPQTSGVQVEVDPDPEAQLQRLDVDARSTAQHADELAGQVIDRRRHLSVVAEAEEALERAEAEERRLRALDATLATAYDFLSEAKRRVHRDIAPKLQASVAGRLPSITIGRYREVTVDPATLEVKVGEAGGEWRPATLLSHGTAEQVYLLLRLAMAEHLCTSGESAPLLLDDVTVQADAERTQGILDLLHEISGERQVVLFTQEEDVVDWAERQLIGPRDAVTSLKPVEAR
jgi:DNA repair protein SbcC/Rad50